MAQEQIEIQNGSDIRSRFDFETQAFKAQLDQLNRSVFDDPSVLDGDGQTLSLAIASINAGDPAGAVYRQNIQSIQCHSLAEEQSSQDTREFVSKYGGYILNASLAVSLFGAAEVGLAAAGGNPDPQVTKHNMSYQRRQP